MNEKDQISIRSTPDPEAPGEGDYSKAKVLDSNPRSNKTKFQLPLSGHLLNNI